LPYEAWYFLHLLVYVAVFLSLWHQFVVGTDLLASRVFYTYWVGIYTVVLGSHLIFRFGRPVYLFFRHQFRVSRIFRENYNTVSIYFTGKSTDQFNIYPGQFMILRFFTKGLWWQAHPFSLSRVPDGKEIRITAKAVGDFTQKLGSVPVGTKVLIDGPYGIFTEWTNESPKVLFIAGGIGITPIRSLMERLVSRGREAVLLYANKTEKDIVFKKELEEVVKRYGGDIVHVLSDEPAYAGEKGFIDTNKIKRLVPDVAKRDVYLCGPPPMMKAVIAALQNLGVSAERIHWERFALE
ncbi:MAG: oxidoreductase, partial [Patescibacteria group bacterium]